MFPCGTRDKLLSTFSLEDFFHNGRDETKCETPCKQTRGNLELEVGDLEGQPGEEDGDRCSDDRQWIRHQAKLEDRCTEGSGGKATAGDLLSHKDKHRHPVIERGAVDAFRRQPSHKHVTKRQE